MEPAKAQRSMTFTGCWTCKKRKVKCDERPSSCGNCMKIKVPCGGYGIRLQWINISNPFRELNKAQRTNSSGGGRIKIDRNTGPTYRTQDIDKFLETLNVAAGSGCSVREGPFTVFPILQTDAEKGDNNKASFKSKPQGQDSTSRGFQHADDSSSMAQSHVFTSHGVPELPSDNNNRLVREHTSAIPNGYKTPQKNAGYITSFSPFSEGLGDTNSSSTVLQIHNTKPFDISSLSSYRLSISTSGNLAVDKLMHHYAEHITVLLQPIEHPQNPYRQLYIPAALEAASSISPMTQTNKPSVQSVILHSLLSSSAFHLWNCLPFQTSYHKLGSQHRQQALFLLQSTIRFEMTTSDYKMLMVAMLSLVTIDFMSGYEADFAIHLQGTQQLRNRRRKWRHISRETRQLNEISDFLHLLARTMTFSSSPRPWPPVNTQDTEGFVACRIESDCCFGYMYGITTVTATNIFETCRLAEYLSWYEQSQEPIPDGLLEACESLGDRLCSWSFQAESSRHISDDEDAFEIFRHHANAWHLAALTYYHRRIQRCWSHDHDQVIAKIAEHMHAVEDIKKRSASNAAKRMAPIMWPAFVASCEATFHDPWILWWQRVQSYHIANYQRLWEVIQQIWQKQEIMSQPAASDFDWIEAFKNLEITLLPI